MSGLVMASPGRKFLERAVAAGVCSVLSLRYYDFFQRLAPGAGDAALVGGALAVQAVLDGHSCLFLAEVAGTLPLAEKMEGDAVNDDCRLPDLDEWQESLLASGFVGRADSTLTPLVLDQGRLYLRRYYDYECRLAAEVGRRANLRGYTPVEVAQVLARLFPTASVDIDWQKVAAAVAAMRRFCLITGGPGTGKTHTVVRIVAVLQQLSVSGPLRIGLAAPTGKAASRLQEALPAAEAALEQMVFGQASVGSLKAQTIHRLLGSIRHSPYFRYNRDHRLPLDVLIVDEVSMVDLALMTKLIEAMPEEGRLVLLGDKDQLSSVEAGMVLADLCRGEAGYSPGFAKELKEAGAAGEGLPISGAAAPLSDCRVTLRRSYRFSPDSGIGALASAVLDGAIDRARALFDKGDGVRLCSPPATATGGIVTVSEFGERLCQGYGQCLRQKDPASALASFRKFQVLCAHRHGPNGSQGINSWFEEVLEEKRMIVRPDGSQWYSGRPVMITGNHYGLQLFNGDLGIVLSDEAGDLRVFFETASGLRSIAPARMPEHDTAYALTVHKSQGSEFDHVLLVLPEASSRLVTRELIYTAITRARKSFELWGRPEILAEGVATTTVRHTGLGERLR